MITSIRSNSSPAQPRRASIRIASAFVFLISITVVIGWSLGNKKLIGAFAGTVPMHPITALALAVAALSLWLCSGKRTLTKTRLGIGCAIAAILVGFLRLSLYVLGAGTAVDQILFRKMILRMSGEYALPIQMAPATSLNLLVIGAALLCAHLRHARLRLIVCVLTFINILFAVLAVCKCVFVNLAPENSDTNAFPMAFSTAVALLVLAGGIVCQISDPAWPALSNESSARANSEHRLSLKNKVTLGFGAAVFMLCGIGIFSYESIAEFIKDSHWDNHTYQVLAGIDRLYSQFKDAEGAERGFIITGDPAFLAVRQTAIDAIPSSLENLQKLTADNSSQQRRIALLKPLVSRKIEIVQALTRLRQDKGFDDARQSLSSGPAVILMDGIHRLLIEMTAEENRLLDKRMADTQTNARRAIALISMGALFALALVMAAGWMLNRDIGGRERAEEALRSSENKFRGLMQSAPDAIVIVTQAGKIELINSQAEQLFGYAAAELVGQNVEVIIPPRYRNGHVKKRDAYFSAPVVRGMGVGQELFGIRKDGSEFPVEISLSPMRTADGLRVSSAIRDITRRRREEEALENLNAALSSSNAQLEAANKELESFSYSVSHDLRAPLRSIDGFSQAILEDYSHNLDPEGQDHLHRVRAASQRMGQLIDDLLNLSRVTRAEIVREQVDLSKMAREIAGELRSVSPDRDVECVIADGLVASTDPRLIRIVLTNLLSNAWKFTGRRQHARIEFGRSGDNGTTEYFMRDNGAGFDPNYTAKLFGAFQRLHSSTEFPGNGIGLATVQRIVRRHGGRVWADGQSDQGATFHFTL